MVMQSVTPAMTRAIHVHATRMCTACSAVRNGLCLSNAPVSLLKEAFMPRGDKSRYTNKQDRQADHIEEGYEKRGVPKKDAEHRAWATVNKMSGGGKKSGSGRGKKTNKEPARKGGRNGGKSAAKKSAARKASRSATGKSATA